MFSLLHALYVCGDQFFCDFIYFGNIRYAKILPHTKRSLIQPYLRTRVEVPVSR